MHGEVICHKQVVPGRKDYALQNKCERFCMRSAAGYCYLDNLIQVAQQGQGVILPEPEDAIMKQILVCFAISHITQMGYQLQRVQWIFFPSLR